MSCLLMAELQDLVAGQHQLADQVHQLVEQPDVDPNVAARDRRLFGSLCTGYSCSGGSRFHFSVGGGSWGVRHRGVGLRCDIFLRRSLLLCQQSFQLLDHRVVVVRPFVAMLLNLAQQPA